MEDQFFSVFFLQVFWDVVWKTCVYLKTKGSSVFFFFFLFVLVWTGPKFEFMFTWSSGESPFF